MQHFGIKGLALAGVAICTTGACSADREWQEAAPHESTNALLGESGTFTDCTAQEIQYLEAGQTLGRIASRSSVFLECLTRAVHDGDVVRHMDGNGTETIGPFEYCTGDPHSGMTPEGRVAHLASISASRLSTDHRCGITVSDGSANGNYDPEKVGWETVSSSSAVTAYMIWHEVTHNYNYFHQDECTSRDHQAPNIQARCMQEILKEANASPECATLVCGPHEVAFPIRYGEFGAGDPCECVPDVFSWPNNQNEYEDDFGQILAVGDFNGDDYDDLAVATPGEGGDTGAVYVFRGAEFGLRFWKRISQYYISAIDYDVEPPNEFDPSQNEGDDFGAALAAGDLNDDGFDELIIGTPGRTNAAGGVYILGGTAMGPDMDQAQWLDQTDSGGSIEPGDRFGAALTVGNFNGDAFQDLAVGTPFEDSGEGRVSIHRGRAGVIGVSSFVTNDSGFLHQALGTWANEANDEFGAALAAGDVDADGLDELIVGSPGENSDSGYIFIAERISGTWDVTSAFSRPSTTRFGEVIAAGDIIGSSTDDFAVGAPDNNSGAGSVFLWRGASGTPVYALEIAGDETDAFGTSIAIGDVAGTSKGDLIVGAPNEAFGTGPAEGRFLVYEGTTSTSFDSTNDGYRSQDDVYSASANDPVLFSEHRGADRFGRAIALGAFNGAGLGFAVGAPQDQIDGSSSGAVFTFDPSWNNGRKLDQVTMRHGDAWPPY